MNHNKINLNEENWKLYIKPNREVCAENFNPVTISDFELCKSYKAEVPSCLEKILFENNVIDDPCFSDNIYKLRKYESYHQWYFAKFDCRFETADITFDGIDTIADVIVNGEIVGHCDNMFIAHTFILKNLKKSGNELIVHIYPAEITARNVYLPAMSFATKYNYPSLALRKSASSFGWDILPRFVCGGITRNITLSAHKEEKLNEVYLYTACLEGNKARLCIYYNFTAIEDDIYDYSLILEGVCGDSIFKTEKKPWHTQETLPFSIENPKLWYPRGYGEQNLYSVTVKLLKKGEVIDEQSFNFGIRTVELERTSLAKNGKFEFRVNGEKVYILGTNWVPTDALRKDEYERTLKALECVKDIGCNAIRVWGGGVYEVDEFYDYCDKNGILVWQDFMMGCAVYPETESFEKQISDEVAAAVKRLRQHCCLLIWAGDNECDCAHKWNGIYNRTPVNYSVSRQTVAKVLRQHDVLRPYLPSSPYIDEVGAATSEYELSEYHLWGPRDYFKGDFYSKAPTLFASETGYHGCPSPQSLSKFLKNPGTLFGEDGNPSLEYLAHSTNSGALESDDPYVYRTKLMADQVVTLFGTMPDDISDFAKASQISQAEAMKYFIERFRIRRNETGGIIWWNILDGWPQVSDAIIDYYFVKKLAYWYIKRSQTPLCFMCDEVDGKLKIYLVNDESGVATIDYCITDIYKGKKILSATATAQPKRSQLVGELEIPAGDKSFYLIEWTHNGKSYSNHFHSGIIDISLSEYLNAIEKCGYNRFEGF